jgi:RNAse (barnase) inhibitor barstar
MNTVIVTVPVDRIVDWESFHRVFEEALGFPPYYGANMNAWIDCLMHADEAEVAHPVEKGAVLVLRIDHAEAFARRCPEQYRAMVECAAFVNYARIEAGEEPILALMMSGSFPHD